jgi:type II secretory pathway pseudopilin PulG
MDAALVAIVGAVVGIVLTNGLKLVLEARARSERVRDIQTALRAEIRSHRQSLELFLDEQRGADSVNQILSEAGFSPFVPREIGSFVFDAIIGDIHILPGSVIDPLVLYYRQWRTLASSIEDMREPSFSALSPPRKTAIYRDYLGVGRYATLLANDAIDAINRSLGDDGEEGLV